jgi:hypothetical protein
MMREMMTEKQVTCQTDITRLKKIKNVRAAQRGRRRRGLRRFSPVFGAVICLSESCHCAGS